MVPKWLNLRIPDQEIEDSKAQIQLYGIEFCVLLVMSAANSGDDREIYER